MADARPRKLSPDELQARGFSRKSERYITSSGDVISKRRYQQTYITGGKSLAQRARDYFAGVVQYATEGLRRAAESRRRYSSLRKHHAKDFTKPELDLLVKLNKKGYEALSEGEVQALHRLRQVKPAAVAAWRQEASPPKKRKAK